jgi:hypothetical protein
MFSLEHMPGHSVNNHLHSPIKYIATERAALDSSQTMVNRITTNEKCCKSERMTSEHKKRGKSKEKQYHAPLK